MARVDCRPSKTHQIRSGQKITREYGLLVKDQDILDLIWSSTLSEIDLLAERFIIIQDAIETLDIPTIDSVAKQSPDSLYRRVVGAIRRGVIDGDAYWAGYTTRVLLAEAFSKTPDYFQALRYYYNDLRTMRKG